MSYKYHCPNCNGDFTTATRISRVRCPYCGKEYSTAYGEPNQPGSGNYYSNPPQSPRNVNVFDNGPSGKSRGIAGLLAILVGSLGVHYFYLGKTMPGVVFLLVSLLSCGTLAALLQIAAIVQGVIMMTGTQEEFERKFVNPAVSFPLF